MRSNLRGTWRQENDRLGTDVPKEEEQKTELKKEDNRILKQFTETKPKILIVDDNSVNRRVACQILTKSGCDVDEADNGMKAIGLLKKQTAYDLIFMDIQMPDMDGVEATQEIKKLKDINIPPIVAMTAYSMEEDREKFLSQGLDDYMSKPIKAHLLIKKVKEWISFDPKHVTTDVFEEETENLIINQNTLNQLFKYGGFELIKSVLHDFDIETKEQLENSRHHFKDKNYEGIRLELHTLKGNAGTLGVERLANTATVIEKKLKEHNFVELGNDLLLLQKAYEEFQEHYQNILET